MEKKRKIDENYADVVINSLRQDDLDILPPKPETCLLYTSPSPRDCS